VNEGGGLECVVSLFRAEIARGKAVQFVVEERE
jgi:hypothetical protein